MWGGVCTPRTDENPQTVFGSTRRPSPCLGGDTDLRDLSEGILSDVTQYTSAREDSVFQQARSPRRTRVKRVYVWEKRKLRTSTFYLWVEREVQVIGWRCVLWCNFINLHCKGSKTCLGFPFLESHRSSSHHERE